MLFIFDIQECTHQRLVANEYEHLSSIKRSPSDGHQDKIGIITKIALTIVNKCWYFMEALSLNKNT
jgi:hypothetical protein